MAGFASGQTLYGTVAANQPTSSLYILNPTTGAVASTVGPIGFAVTGLAIHPTTGILYGSVSNNSANSPGSLITINKTTGQGTLVGSYGIGGQTMADLTFTSDGTLYGWLEAGTDALFTINLTTGAATLVGDPGLSTFGSGLAAGPGDVLYYAGDGGNGPLRTVNRTTGAVTTIATLSNSPAPQGESIAALAFNGGTLYGVHLNTGVTPRVSTLITINTATGVINSIGVSVSALDAIVFDGSAPPPPSTQLQPVPASTPWTLAALALLLAMGAWMAMRGRI